MSAGGGLIARCPPTSHVHHTCMPCDMRPSWEGASYYLTLFQGRYSPAASAKAWAKGGKSSRHCAHSSLRGTCPVPDCGPIWRMYSKTVCGYGIYYAPSLAPHRACPPPMRHAPRTDAYPGRGAVAYDPRPRPVRSRTVQSRAAVAALAPPARFPCDQERDRWGWGGAGSGTWRMAPPPSRVGPRAR